MKKPWHGGLGDAPVDPEYVEKMNALAQVLQEWFNGKGTRISDSKTGFILMAFKMNEHEGRANYISNCNRDDVLVLLKEQITRFEGMPQQKGHA